MPRRGRARLPRLLPVDPKRRLRTVQTLVACSFSVASIAFLVFAGLAGFSTIATVLLWSAITLGGSLGFYLAIRTGWSERLRDPSMTISQMVYATTACAVIYTQVGALRGAIPVLLMVVMMFGMFALPTRKVIGVCLFALLAFAGAMALAHLRHPDVAPAAVEWGHFLMLATVMPAVAVLAERLRHMRRRLHDQKRDLAQALHEIELLASRDSLTGLSNRRWLEELLQREMARCERSGSRLAFALLDIDHFKRVNDQHGHACGDAVLVAFGQTILNKVRTTDAVARWGGEEFVLVMPDTDLSNAALVAERLRGATEGLVVQHGEQSLSITVSIGLTEFRSGESSAALAQRADEALYAAKAGGRNRVVTH
jgi:diguanylate cyclase (GGDEF)-like protein